MSANPVLRDFLEPLGMGRRKNGTRLQGDYFPVPLRTAMRVGLRILSLVTADKSRGSDDPIRGDNAQRIYAEEIIECYMAQNFRKKTGTHLREAFHHVAELMHQGKTEQEACEIFISEFCNGEEETNERKTAAVCKA